MNKQYNLTLNNSLSELKNLKNFINRVSLKHNIPKEIISHIQLSLEELIVNIISYNYKDKFNHTIKLKIKFNTKRLIFYLMDEGEPFNPLMFTSQDTHSDLKKKKIGGLGILLAKNFMDHISYSYKSGFNNLTMIKKLP